MNNKKNYAKEYMTTEQIADLLQVNTATVRNWTKLKKIKVYKYIGRQPLYLKSEIEELKRRITSGEDTSLKKRRNKKHTATAQLYSAYIKDKSRNQEFCHLLNAYINNNKLSDGNILYILAECTVRLFFNINNISYKSNTSQLLELCKSKTEYLTYKDNSVFFKLISDLLGTNILKTENTEYFYNSFSNCSHIFSSELIFDKEEDLLGLLYLSLRSIGSRKNSGAYFTPLQIARKLNSQIFTQNTADCNDSLILDPSCGSGSFLLTLPKVFTFKNIYGNDIDFINVCIIRINFFLRNLTLTYDDLCSHFTCSDFLTSPPDLKFNYIIGNPPWGSQLDSEYLLLLKDMLNTANKKSADSFALFTEQAINCLKENGRLGFILPKSLFFVKAHRNIREILLENGRLNYVENLAEAFKNINCPGTFIVWKKCHTPNEVSSITVHNQDKTFSIDGSRKFTPDFMPVFLSDEKYKNLCSLLNTPNCVFLKDHADFGLGIVTGNNKERLSPLPTNHNLPILKGTDISRYKINTPSAYLDFSPETVQQSAPLALYRAPEKLVYRFINKHLTFALDANGYLTLNSCNFLIPKIEGLDIKYILSVLNSAPVQFIYENMFSSVKVLRSHIESLPIPFADYNTQKTIIDYVNQITDCNSKDEFAYIDKQIDKLIWNLFK